MSQTPAFLTVTTVVKGQASKLGQVPNIGIRLHQDLEGFRAIEEHFLKICDKYGVPMAEVCKEYWERKKRERGE